MKLFIALLVSASFFTAGYVSHSAKVESDVDARMRVFMAHERVSAFVRGETFWVYEEDLDLVNPELRQAALDKEP